MSFSAGFPLPETVLNAGSITRYSWLFLFIPKNTDKTALPFFLGHEMTEGRGQCPPWALLISVTITQYTPLVL